jgi:hypothetical protein
MSNLSELLPAGAGAKSADFVASGTLGSGVTVALNSNGTVSVVAGNANPQDVGTLTEYSPNAEFPSACYDTDNEKIVVVYKDRDNSSYPTARVGTISGSSISFGTAVAFHSYSGSDFAAVYDKTAQRVVVAFRDSDQSYRLSAVAGVVSGTSISFGSVTTGLSSFNSEGVSGDYHATQGVVVFAWRSNQGADVFLTSRTVSTSGTTLTFGTRAEWSDYILRACKTVYDANANKMVYAVETQTGADGYALHATVSSGSISYSGEDQFSTTVSRPEIVYVSSLRKCLIVYKGTGDVLTAVVAYPAGNGVDFGAETFSTIQMDTGIQPVYDPIANKVVVLFEDNQVTPRTQNLVEISISGTTPSFSAVTNVSNVQRNGTQDAGYAGTYDAVAKRSFFTYIEDSTFDAIGFSYQVERAADSNYTDFIGITDQAIADTATGAVIVQGGVSEKLSGLTVGADYYVQADGSISSPTVSGPYVIAGATYVQGFSVNAQEAIPTGLAFNTDGTKMFVSGQVGQDINEYALTTGFDVSTASFTQNFSVSAQETAPMGVAFNTDGTKMFVVGSNGDDVNEYTLSTGFDLGSTVTFIDSFSVAPQETNPIDIAFNTDGTKMFIVGGNGQDILEYALSAGFDVSTASYTQNFSVASQETGPTGMTFNTDGTKMFVVGNVADNVNSYDLSTGFDLSTASFASSFSVAANSTSPQAMSFNTTGNKMFIVGSAADSVNQYSTGVGSVTSVPAGRGLSSTSILLEG